MRTTIPRAVPHCTNRSWNGNFGAALAHLRSPGSKCIGAGDFGRVFLVPRVRDHQAAEGGGQYVTVKELSLSEPSSRCEILMHKYLYDRTAAATGQSTVVPAVYETCEDRVAAMDPCGVHTAAMPGGVVYAVMEFCTAGDLRSLYLRKITPGNAALLVYDTMKQVASALVALQAQFRFTHWDLHSENVLVTHDATQPSGYRAMLYDFGFARFEVEQQKCSLSSACCFPVGRRFVVSNRLGTRLTDEHLPFYQPQTAFERRKKRGVRPVNKAAGRARRQRQIDQKNARAERRRAARGLAGGAGREATCAVPHPYYPYNQGYDFAVLGAYVYYELLVENGPQVPRAVGSALKTQWIDQNILTRTVADPRLRPSCADQKRLERHNSELTLANFERLLSSAIG